MYISVNLFISRPISDKLYSTFLLFYISTFLLFFSDPDGAMDNDRGGSKNGEKYGEEEDSDASEDRGEHRTTSTGGISRGNVNPLRCLPLLVRYFLQHSDHIIVFYFLTRTVASSKSHSNHNKSDDKTHKKKDRKDGNNEGEEEKEKEEEEEFNEADYSNQERITKQSLKASKRKIRNDKKSGKNRRKRDVDSDSDTEREEESADELPSTSQNPNGRLRKGTSSLTAAAVAANAAATTDSSSSSSSSFLNKADKNDSGSGSDDLHINSDTESADSSGNEKVENSKRRDKEARNRLDRSEDNNSSSRTMVPSQVTKEVKKSTIKWTAEEDRIVKEQFRIFKGSRSVFEMISMDEDLM